MSYGKRIDGNQRRLDDLARKLGAVVIPTTGDPDIGFDRLYIRDKIYIVEVKDGSLPPSRRMLTDGEIKRKAQIEGAGGVYNVVETDDDLMKLFGFFKPLR